MKLSIVTVNLNNAPGLSRTLESTFHHQAGFDDWEQIVVDGASSDGSFAELDRYRGNPHLGWCVSEPDTGIYGAMNKGAAHARGDFLLFLNSGDELLPNVLAKVFANSWSADIVYGDLIDCARPGSDVLREYPEPDDIVPAYFLFGSLPHPASFISKRLLSRLGGYDESFRIVSDAKFFLNAASGGATMKHLPFPVSRFFLNGMSSTPEHWDDLRAERERMLSAVFGKQAARDAVHPWVRQTTAMAAGRDPAFAAVLLRATDLCGALWRTRIGRGILTTFARFVERREKRISRKCGPTNAIPTERKTP